LLLLGECLIKHELVALFLKSQLLFAKGLFCVVVTKEFKVPLLAKQMSLAFHLTLILFLLLPLSVKHLTFKLSEFLLLVLGLLSGILLPVEDSHSVCNSLFLLLNFLALAFFLGHEVKLPKLSINILLHDLLVNCLAFVNQLLFSILLALQNEELALLVSQFIGSCDSYNLNSYYL